MLGVYSVNNNYVSLEERERYTLLEERKAQLYTQLKQYGLSQVVILSTCQRLEIYITSSKTSAVVTKRCLIAFFNITEEMFLRHFRYIKDEACLVHLLEVATGLLANVIGETQVLGQVKTAYLEACQYNAVKKQFHVIFQNTLRFSKKMHRETNINDHPVSLSYSSYQLVHQRLQGKGRILLLGTGKMGRYFIDYFLKNKNNEANYQLIVLNRTIQPLKINDVSLKTEGLSSLCTYLPTVDIIISTLAVSTPIIKQRELMTISRKKELLLIDLSVPRSIEPSVGTLFGVTLLNVDTLSEHIDRHHFQRKEKANQIRAHIRLEIKRWPKTLE